MDKLDILKYNISKFSKICIAYSGGVDSTFLLKVALDILGHENVLPIIVDGAVMPRIELKEALDIANELHAKCHILKIDVLNVPELQMNDKRRCYFCKKNIFSKIKDKAKELGIDVVLDGKNLDDKQAYRPGAEAAKELSIISPLFDAELTKDEIRKYSKQMGLKTWNKPSNACLVTRIPYDTKVTEELLSKIEKLEEIFKNKGFNNIRIRVHDNIVRIEVPKERFQEILDCKDEIKLCKDLGFLYVTLDLEGLRSGSMDI